MARLITTAGHKRINLPHSNTIVQFEDGKVEVTEEVAAEVLEHFGTSVIRFDEEKPKHTTSKK